MRRAKDEWVAVSASECGLVDSCFACGSEEDARRYVRGEGLPEGDLSRRACEQLAAYFREEGASFAFPFDLRGFAEFTTRVLEEVARIPWGETRTYGEVAAAVGQPGAARAVGQVMARRNPVAPFIPCHRVLGSDGLHGYAGGLPLKQRLLDIEQRTRGE